MIRAELLQLRLVGASSRRFSCVSCSAAAVHTAPGLWSVIIPTYNRLPILRKCLSALENQVGCSKRYEVIVVDDGSTDGTLEFLLDGRHGQILDGTPLQSARFPYVRVVWQNHAGATRARNLGFRNSRGSTIVFIDSDLVVSPHFLEEHATALDEAYAEDGDDRAFTYGRVINTSNFEHPQSEKFKITDTSRAFFATGNVAISRSRLLDAARLLHNKDADAPFDADFSEYGWEDLELGMRLRKRGARLKHAPRAVGYHWHPAFSCDQLPKLIEQERQRGRSGVKFYCKHPSMRVRLMIQMTPFHEGLWFFLTFGGLLNEKILTPFLQLLVETGNHKLAAALAVPLLNWCTVQAVKQEAERILIRKPPP